MPRSIFSTIHKHYLGVKRVTNIDINNKTFIWSNCHGGTHQVACCLDQFFLSKGLLGRDVFV